MIFIDPKRLKTEQALRPERSHGLVYPYKDTTGSIPRVVKQLVVNDLAELPSITERIVLAIGLDHPNILPIGGYDIEYKADDSSCNVYIMLPKKENTLARLIHSSKLNNTPIKPEFVVTVAKALKSAVDYLHNNGLAHLNIKPENILFDNEDVVWLTDMQLKANPRNLKECFAIDISSSGKVLAEMMLFNNHSSMDLELPSALESAQVKGFYSASFIDIVKKMLDEEPPKRLLKAWSKNLVPF